MVYVVYLLLSNISFAGGAAAGPPLFKAIPYIVVATFLIGLTGVHYLRARNRPVYDAIGRTVFEETHKRVPAGAGPR